MLKRDSDLVPLSIMSSSVFTKSGRKKLRKYLGAKFAELRERKLRCARNFSPRKERLDYKLAKMWFVGKGESRFPRTRGCRLPLFLHSKSDLTIPAWARTHLVYCRSYRMGCVRDRMARDRDRARDRSLRDFLAVFR